MVLLAAGSQLWGPDFAVGRMVDGVQEISTYHEMAGYAVFAVALLGMFAIASALERRKRKAKATQDVAAPGLAVMAGGALTQKALALVGVVVSTLLLCGFVGGQPPLGPPGVVNELPMRVGQTQGWKGEADQREVNLLADDVQILRNYYILPTGGNVACSVVLSGAERRSLHRPEVCLPAQGWNVTDKRAIPVELPDGKQMTVMLVRMLRDFADDQGQLRRVRALNLFFYAGSHGVTTPDYYDHVFLSYLHGLTRNLNHRWALVSFYMPFSETDIGVSDPMGELAAVEQLREFVSQMVPEMLAESAAE
jgi:hypothetical protein